MSLASRDDVEARLGRTLTTTEADRIDALLDDASAVVVGYCGQHFATPPVPSAVVGVVAKMVARQLDRAASAGGALAAQQSMSAGPYQQQVSYAATTAVGDAWFTNPDRTALRPYRRGGGLTSVPLAGERHQPQEF